MQPIYLLVPEQHGKIPQTSGLDWGEEVGEVPSRKARNSCESCCPYPEKLGANFPSVFLNSDGGREGLVCSGLNNAAMR